MAHELPDFHIPHAEKIEWMIDTSGWALEPVPANLEVDPPRPGYTYSIGFPEAFGFPDVLMFGLTPVATKVPVRVNSNKLTRTETGGTGGMHERFPTSSSTSESATRRVSRSAR